MKYDQAGWHYGGKFPKGVPEENGGTHIGMFLAWAIMSGLENQSLGKELSTQIAAVRERKMTGRQFLFEVCDEKLADEELNEEGNAFAAAYYKNHYFQDYERTLRKWPKSPYEVEDTWDNFDKIAAVISRRFAAWKPGRILQESGGISGNDA